MMGKGGGGGGKMDDITVVCAFVGPTEEAQEEIMKSVQLAAGLYDDLMLARNKAKGEEAKTLRTVQLRKKMDEAFEESKAKRIWRKRSGGAVGIFQAQINAHGFSHNQKIIARERLTDEWKVGAVETTLSRRQTHVSERLSR